MTQRFQTVAEAAAFTGYKSGEDVWINSGPELGSEGAGWFVYRSGLGSGILVTNGRLVRTSSTLAQYAALSERIHADLKPEFDDIDSRLDGLSGGAGGGGGGATAAEINAALKASAQPVMGEVFLGSAAALSSPTIDGIASAIDGRLRMTPLPVSGVGGGGGGGGATAAEINTALKGSPQPVSGTVAVTGVPSASDIATAQKSSPQPVTVSSTAEVSTGDRIVLARPALAVDMISGVSGAMTTTTSTQVLAAPGAGRRNHITTIVVSNASSAVDTAVAIRDGSGGEILMMIPAASGCGGAALSLPTPLRQPTVNTALHASCATPGADVRVSVVGYSAA